MSSRTAGDQTYYEILGIPHEASPEDIKAAYRQALLCLHPDKSLSTAPTDADPYLKLHAAWQVCFPAHRECLRPRAALACKVASASRKNVCNHSRSKQAACALLYKRRNCALLTGLNPTSLSTAAG